MDSPLTTTDTDQALWSIEEILDTLDDGPPSRRREAIQQARIRRDAVVPHLIEAIESTAANLQDGVYPDGDLSFLALFLLTEFRAKEALPAILNAVILPDGDLDLLFSDAITEYLYVALSTLADDSLQSIEQLILDRGVEDFVRWAALHSYLNLFHRGILTRDEVVSKFRSYLEIAISTNDSALATNVVSEIVTYAPSEAMPCITRAFELKLVNESVIRMETVHSLLAQGEAFTAAEVARWGHLEPPDTIEYLEDWGIFNDPEPITYPEPSLTGSQMWDDYDPQDDIDDYGPPAVETIRNTAPKVGRNDPCTCGSGKKFKKCCGKT